MQQALVRDRPPSSSPVPSHLLSSPMPASQSLPPRAQQAMQQALVRDRPPSSSPVPSHLPSSPSRPASQSLVSRAQQTMQQPLVKNRPPSSSPAPRQLPSSPVPSHLPSSPVRTGSSHPSMHRTQNPSSTSVNQTLSHEQPHWGGGGGRSSPHERYQPPSQILQPGTAMQFSGILADAGPAWKFVICAEPQGELSGALARLAVPLRCCTLLGLAARCQFVLRIHGG